MKTVNYDRQGRRVVVAQTAHMGHVPALSMGLACVYTLASLITGISYLLAHIL